MLIKIFHDQEVICDCYRQKATWIDNPSKLPLERINIKVDSEPVIGSLVLHYIREAECIQIGDLAWRWNPEKFKWEADVKISLLKDELNPKPSVRQATPF